MLKEIVFIIILQNNRISSQKFEYPSYITTRWHNLQAHILTVHLALNKIRVLISATNIFPPLLNFPWPMSFHVSCNIRFLGECLLTYNTRIWFIASMNSIVGF
jgi:hypothetical protein